MLIAVLAVRSKQHTSWLQGIYCGESKSIGRKFQYCVLKAMIEIKGKCSGSSKEWLLNSV